VANWGELRQELGLRIVGQVLMGKWRAGADPVVLGSAISRRDLGRFQSTSTAADASGRSQTLNDNVCGSPPFPSDRFPLVHRPSLPYHYSSARQGREERVWIAKKRVRLQ
jgi:hypothetical protein